MEPRNPLDQDGNGEPLARNVKKATTWDQAVGRELRRCREQRNMSQPRVQELVDGLEGTMLGAIERGINRVTVGMLVEVCRALSVEPETILRRAGIIGSDDELTLADRIALDPDLTPASRLVLRSNYETLLKRDAYEAAR